MLGVIQRLSPSGASVALLCEARRPATDAEPCGVYSDGLSESHLDGGVKGNVNVIGRRISGENLR